MKLLYVLLTIFLVKLLFNISQYIKAKALYNRYSNWVKNPNEYFRTYNESIKNLFKSAGISDSLVPLVDSVGYGLVRTGSASVFNNIFVLRTDIVQAVFGMFQSAIGVFRSRIIETFSPLYWIRTITFLPAAILNYLNLDPEKTSYRLLNVVFTFIWWVILTCMTFFKEQIKFFIINLLKVSS